MEATETPPVEKEHRPSLVMLSYTEGVSEDVRRVCRKFAMKVVFRSRQCLCSMLTKVKDPLTMGRSKPRWCIASPAAVARATLERQ